MKERLIGIDAGGTMTKVVLFDVAGNELACERQPNHVLLPHAGWVERDGEAMWTAVCISLKALLEKTGTDPADIIAVTPSGYGGGVYLVDKDGINVRNGVISPDTRAIPVLDKWHATGVARQIIPEIESNLWPGQTFSLLGWFKEHEPDTLRRTAHVLSCKDFLRLRLCGDVSTDPTDGGCAGVINVTRSDISQDAFAIAGMKEWLPKLAPVRNAVEIAGRITAAAARETGLKEGTPVCRGVYRPCNGCGTGQPAGGCGRHLQHSLDTAPQADTGSASDDPDPLSRGWPRARHHGHAHLGQQSRMVRQHIHGGGTQRGESQGRQCL